MIDAVVVAIDSFLYGRATAIALISARKSLDRRLVVSAWRGAITPPGKHLHMAHSSDFKSLSNSADIVWTISPKRKRETFETGVATTIRG